MSSVVELIVEASTAAAEAALGKFSKETKLSLTDIKSGFEMAAGTARQVMGTIKEFYDATVTEAVKYSDQVRDLGRSIGASAEEASMLIQAADDVFISYETMTSAMEAAIRKGVNPSIDGIGRLADQYNAIQDPIERTKFLMDNFGRSGADLAPLMEKGAQGIRDLGQAAKDAGLVLDQSTVDAALRYKEAQDQLRDSTQAVTITIGNEFIPALTDSVRITEVWLTLGQRWKQLGDLLAVTHKKQAVDISAIAAETNDAAEMMEYYNTTVRSTVKIGPSMDMALRREVEWLKLVGINASMATGSYMELNKQRLLAASMGIDADKATQELMAMAGAGGGGFLQTGRATGGISPYYDALKRQIAAMQAAMSGGGGGAAPKESTLEGGETAKLITDIAQAEAQAADVIDTATVSTEELGSAQQVLNTATGALVQTSPSFQEAVKANTTTLGDLASQAGGAAGNVSWLNTELGKIPPSKTSVVTVIHRDVYTSGTVGPHLGNPILGNPQMHGLTQAVTQGVRDGLIQSGAWQP